MWKLHKIIYLWCKNRLKPKKKHLHVKFTSDIEPPQQHLQLKITWGIQTKQWHLHVEIDCEVKSKQWHLHAKVTCDVETKQWLEVIKCIVHVMTCLHLYLILVIISGCGNKSDYWGQGRIWAWNKNNAALLVKTIYLRKIKHIQSKPISTCVTWKQYKNKWKIYFFQTWSTWSEKKVCTLYAVLMRSYFFSKKYLASKLIYFTRQK